MGFSISPSVANLLMKDLEARALGTPTHPESGLGMWITPFSVQRAENFQQFLTHLNSLTLHRQFTIEALTNKDPSPSWRH